MPVREFPLLPEDGEAMHRRNGEHPHGDTGQLIFLVLFLVVWVGDSFFLHVSTFVSHFVSAYLRLVLVALGLAIAVYLARSGHAVVNPERGIPGIVSTGAFRYVRHPLYLGSILFFICLAVATASLISLVLSAGIAVFYDHIASYEERVLEVKYGEEYSKYRARTGKWLPGIRGHAESRRARK
jgi:protein-S-isoprenylcysteine O-methyltransferase Ste14